MGTGAFGNRLYIFLGAGLWGWEHFGGNPHKAWDNFIFGPLVFEGGGGRIWMGVWGQEHGDTYFFGRFSDLISVFILGDKNVWVSAWR